MDSDNPYPIWRQERCQLCKAGRPIARGIFRLNAKPMHEHYSGNPEEPFAYTLCAAPTETEYIAELTARIAELEKDRARLELERNCAVGVLLMAPQAPAHIQYCPDWVDSYRVWWIRRLPGTGELLDAAMNQTAQEQKG